MRAATIVLAAAAAAATLGVAFAAAPCSYTHETLGASFNLEPLVSSTYYSVLDMDAGHEEGRNWTYVFNVCDNIGYSAATIPTTHPPDGEDNDCEAALSVPSPALQVGNVYNWCYRLAGEVTGAESVQFGLVDETAPHRGVTLTYSVNGGPASECAEGISRDLELAFLCADDVTNSFDEEEFVEETDQCHYEIQLKSAYGCPTQCTIVDGHVCNAHGVCGFNYDTNTAGCFCNEGWKGDDCTTESGGGGVSGTGVVLILVCILLAAIMAAVVFATNKLRRLKVDPNSFKELQGLYNELGQVT